MPIIHSPHSYTPTLAHTHTHTRTPARHAQHVATCYVNGECESRRASTRNCQQICQLEVRALACFPSLHLPLSLLISLSLFHSLYPSPWTLSRYSTRCFASSKSTTSFEMRINYAHTAERNEKGMQWNGVEWNTGNGHRPSARFLLIQATNSYDSITCLTAFRSPSLSLFPSLSLHLCLFWSCHLR